MRIAAQATITSGREWATIRLGALLRQILWKDAVRWNHAYFLANGSEHHPALSSSLFRFLPSGNVTSTNLRPL